VSGNLPKAMPRAEGDSPWRGPSDLAKNPGTLWGQDLFIPREVIRVAFFASRVLSSSGAKQGAL